MCIPAILLAAGASRRLGQAKQLVRVGGETLLGRTMRVTREAGAEPVFVVLGAEQERIASATEWADAVCVVNPDWETGMASSIRAGLAELEREAPGAAAVLLLVCDQPQLSAEHLRALMHAAGNDGYTKIVASRYAGRQGVPAIFPKREFSRLLALRGDEGARRLLAEAEVIAVDFGGGEMDVDTAEDLERATAAERSESSH